jgi:hypothetical protein
MARKKKSDDTSSPEEQTNLPDDTFGLPEIQYEPIREEEIEESSRVEEPEAHTTEEVTEPVNEQVGESAEEAPYTHTRTVTFESSDETTPIWPKVLGLVLIILLAGAAIYYFLVYKPHQEEELRRQLALKEQQEQEERLRREEMERLRQAQLEAERRMADSLAALPKTGTIETLEQRTGRYYVVVASAIDGDLIMDYARKLSAEGVSSKIIPPFGKHKFYRIAVADGDTFADAQVKAEGLKPNYGDAVWVLKY